MIKYFLDELGLEVNHRSKFDGRTALLVAAKNPSTTLATYQVLIERGADINILDKQ